MGNMYDNTCSSSSSSYQLLSSSSRAGVSASSQQDELSLFLHQILLRSSSSSPASSSSSFMSSQFRPESSHLPPSRPFLVSGQSSSSRGVIFSDSGDYFPGNVSSSVGAFENNDLDDYDCESEEGLEALVEGVAVKPVSARNSSKRTRAAEVHNLSEKRRRSRINEKMKALQKLIPNSNKTDKASMLDEAIEYLKQLQLQVQMLSMRSGLSLRPMCLPGVLQPLQLSQMKMSFDEGNSSFHMNMTGTLSMNQETGTQNAYSLPNQCFPSNLPSIPNTTQIINPETSLGLESSIHDHLETFQLHRSSDKVRGEDMLPHQQLHVTHPKTNPLVSLPFGTQASIPNHNAPLEPCIIGRELPEGVLLKNVEQNQIISSSSFNSMYGKRRAMRDDLKIEGP